MGSIPDDRAQEKKLDELPSVPDRSADLVEEARIAGAGLGSLGRFSFFQLMVYLAILAALGFIIVWVFRKP